MCVWGTVCKDVVLSYWELIFFIFESGILVTSSFSNIKYVKYDKNECQILNLNVKDSLEDITPAEELCLDSNKGRSVLESFQGGTATVSGPARNTDFLIQGTLLHYYYTGNTIRYLYCYVYCQIYHAVSGNTLTDPEPPDDQTIQWVLLNMAEGVDGLRWKDCLTRLKKA